MGRITVASALLVLLHLVSTPRARAQTSVADQLNAEHAKQYLYLSKSTNVGKGRYEFEYSVDKYGSLEELTPLPDLLTVTAPRRRGLNVMLSYVNPIRFSWETSETSSDDPTFLAAQQFFASAATFFSTLEGSAGGGGAASLVGSGAAPFAAARSDLGNRNRDPVFAATALLEWSLWLVERDSCFNRPEDRDALIGRLSSVDAMLYGTDSSVAPPSVRTAAQFRRAMFASLRILADAESVKEMLGASTQARDSLKILADANTTVKSLIAGIGPVGKSVFKDSPACKNFALYTNSVLETFRNQSTDRLVVREKVVTDLSALRNKVDSLFVTGPQRESKAFRLVNVRIPPGKQKDVTVTLRERELSLEDSKLTVSEKGESKAIFRVQEHNMLLMEFAPGVAYTNVRFPQYGTAEVDSKTVVVRADDDVQHAAAVGMLNMIPNYSWGFAHPTFQLGVGTSKTYPLLLAGLGIRLGGQFSLTGGTVLYWARDLEKLKVGNPVSGTADIESDLKYQLQKRAFYAAFQRGF